MRRVFGCGLMAWVVLHSGVVPRVVSGEDAPLPPGVHAVWDLGKAYRETTPTRERLSINGLWRWQPAEEVGDTRG